MTDVQVRMSWELGLLLSLCILPPYLSSPIGKPSLPLTSTNNVLHCNVLLSPALSARCMGEVVLIHSVIVAASSSRG